MFGLANIFNAMELVRENNRKGMDIDKWHSLDPEHIEKRWATRISHRDIRSASGFFNALAWFSLIIPVMQIALVLSKGGRRKIGVHVWMVALVFGGSLTELLCRLMTIGMDNTTDWIASDFNLQDWGVSTGNDGVGWRVAEVLHLLCQGIMLWVEAFEWLALGGIMLLIFYSVSTETVYSFPPRWGSLSFLIAILSFFTFAANVFRLEQHKIYAPVSIALTVVNAFILFPIWFISLSSSLPEALADVAAAKIDENAEEIMMPQDA